MIETRLRFSRHFPVVCMFAALSGGLHAQTVAAATLPDAPQAQETPPSQSGTQATQKAETPEERRKRAQEELQKEEH
ncbi:MAG TPA: hypothetical protein VJS11_05855, partial [Acidobacteriaceae bacterium]|nr:hypothetical protein [Acidobacteriaceae bacterium]